jgi:hypothetical protein
VQYEGNPKHKPVPSPGKRGSICPPLSADVVSNLLAVSVVDGHKRYASDGSQAFCAQQHDVARDAWHGYPVTWIEVPPRVRKALVDGDQVTHRVVRRGLRGTS